MIDSVIPCTCSPRTAAAKGLELCALPAYLPDLVKDTLAGDRDLCNRQHGSYIFLPYLACSEAHYLTKGHHEFNAVVNRDTFVLGGQKAFCNTRVHPFLHLQHLVQFRLPLILGQHLEPQNLLLYRKSQFSPASRLCLPGA